MISSVRNSIKHLRLWLLAAATVLLLTSVIEAGHAHGTFTEADDHCVLCHHSVALDKTLISVSTIFIPQLFAVFISGLLLCFRPCITRHFALIRAPPTQLHARNI